MTKYTHSVAVCINGAGKRERKFPGRASSGAVSKWLQTIGGHEATVHYYMTEGNGYSEQVLRTDYTTEERIERDQYLIEIAERNSR